MCIFSHCYGRSENYPNRYLSTGVIRLRVVIIINLISIAQFSSFRYVLLGRAHASPNVNVAPLSHMYIFARVNRNSNLEEI